MNNKRVLRVRTDDNVMKRMYAKLSKIMGLIEKLEKSLRKKKFGAFKLERR